MMLYDVKRELSIAGLANNRYADISISESRRADRTEHGCPRVIGGDKGDLGFYGYDVHVGENKTVLYKPVLITCIGGLNEDEVFDIAEEILMNSFESVGIETVEHS